ncbi:hypothetical protein [Haladaptatus sp. NG-WS-4]
MYSAPPEKTVRDDNNTPVDEESTESTDERITPGADANWTGTVPADD